MAEDAASDWLDANCWQCGSDEVGPSKDGRVLCPACRQELFGGRSPADSLRVSDQTYWEPNALDRCWLCMTGSVDPQDDLGLCGDCR